MRIDLWLITYNGMGGLEELSQAGNFLSQDVLDSFGSAITSFELYAHVKTRRAARPTLGEMKERFSVRLEALPRVRFVRKHARFDISYVSHLGDEEDLRRKKTIAESLTLFSAACREIASMLELAEKRLKKADDFDSRAFTAHINQQLSQLPATVDDFTHLLLKMKDAETKRRKAVPTVATLSAHALRNKPKSIAINHDEYHARYVGRTADGGQFLLTTPFVPAVNGNAGREFVALYIFDGEGGFLEAHIDDLGTRVALDRQQARNIFERRLAELGPVIFGRIEVQPFQLQRFDTVFGLVPELLEDEGDNWGVTLQPGNYMAFFKPWDSGDYDT